MSNLKKCNPQLELSLHWHRKEASSQFHCFLFSPFSASLLNSSNNWDLFNCKTFPVISSIFQHSNCPVPLKGLEALLYTLSDKKSLKSDIAQVIEQGLDEIFSRGLNFKSGEEGLFFNREIQLLVMNPRQDLNYHAETHLSYINRVPFTPSGSWPA